MYKVRKFDDTSPDHSLGGVEITSVGLIVWTYRTMNDPETTSIWVRKST